MPEPRNLESRNALDDPPGDFLLGVSGLLFGRGNGQLTLRQPGQLSSTNGTSGGFALGVGTASATSSAMVPGAAMVASATISVLTPYTPGTILQLGNVKNPQLLGAFSSILQSAGTFPITESVGWGDSGPLIATIAGSPSAGACPVAIGYATPATPIGVRVFAWATATLTPGGDGVGGFEPGYGASMLPGGLVRLAGWLKVLDTTDGSLVAGVPRPFAIPPDNVTPSGGVVYGLPLAGGETLYGCIVTPNTAGVTVTA
jgi:hypothetical protein